MFNNKFIGKSTSLFISILLIFILFFNSIPTSVGVYVTPGTPHKTSVMKGTTIIFNNIDLTIRGSERIPVEYLEFVVLQNNNQIAHVTFSIDGTIIAQNPPGRFTIDSLFDLSDISYGYGGSYFGYDELEGTNHSYSYGYGYGTSGYSDIHLQYTITYKTHKEGTFHAKLNVNSNTHTYESQLSPQFMVTPSELEPNTWYVDDDNTDGPWNGTIGDPFNTISMALESSESGDTIYVSSGTYYESTDIDKSITLIGTGTPSPQILIPSNQDYVFTITADHVDITNFELQGVYLYSADYCNITYCQLSQSQYGLHIRQSQNSYVAYNEILSNENIGIFLNNAPRNVLTDNTYDNNTIGITITKSNDNDITDSRFINNTKGFYFESSSMNRATDNIITENTYGIDIVSSQDNIIQSNDINSNSYGIQFIISSNNDIIDNTIQSNTEKGIIMKDSSHNTIHTNYIEQNTFGVYLDSSQSNRLYNNYFDNPTNAWTDTRNFWNKTMVTSSSGTNIIGGPLIGGNYWHDYTGLDLDGDGLGDTLKPYTGSGQIQYGGDYYPLTTVNSNTAPNAPSKPFGPTSGETDTSYTYRSTGTDPDDDVIYYKWQWKEGLTSDWFGPFESGEPCEVSYRFSSEGEYNIRVKVKDEYGAESDWSDPLSVTMPKSKDGSSPLDDLLDRLLLRFPILSKVIEILRDVFTSVYCMVH